MFLILQDIFTRINTALEQANVEREKDGALILNPVHLRVLGQFALLVHPRAATELALTATRDIDATMVGDWSARWIVRTIINQSGYIYDDLSHEAWIPPEAKFEKIFAARMLHVEVIAPVFNLLTKAVKAPERNRNLIAEGLAVFGDELLGLLNAHHVDIEYFISRSPT